MAEYPTLVGLIERLVIPYLYNHSYHEQSGKLPVGELDHGALGLVDDYEKLFRLQGWIQCVKALQFLGMKKRIANKKPCPCQSGRRLGKCRNLVLNPLRKIESRTYFRKQALDLIGQIRSQDTELEQLPVRLSMAKARHTNSS